VAKLDDQVRFRHALMALAFSLPLLAGFGAWVISRAEAATEEPRRAIERVEQKVDQVLFLLLEDK